MVFKVFESFKETMGEFDNDLAYANSRSRMRMITKLIILMQQPGSGQLKTLELGLTQ